MVCIPRVPFNGVNVPGRRQEGSSIIKLIETRGWVRNLKTIYRGKKVELWWEEVRSRGPRLASTREGRPGGESCCVRCLFQRAPLHPRLPRPISGACWELPPKCVIITPLPLRGEFPVHGSELWAWGH